MLPMAVLASAIYYVDSVHIGVLWSTTRKLMKFFKCVFFSTTVDWSGIIVWIVGFYYCWCQLVVLRIKNLFFSKWNCITRNWFLDCDDCMSMVLTDVAMISGRPGGHHQFNGLVLTWWVWVEEPRIDALVELDVPCILNWLQWKYVVWLCWDITVGKIALHFNQWVTKRLPSTIARYNFHVLLTLLFSW